MDEDDSQGLILAHPDPSLAHQLKQGDEQPDQFRLRPTREDILELLRSAGAIDRIDNILCVECHGRVIHVDLVDLPGPADLLEHAPKGVDQIPDVDVLEFEFIR